MERIETISRYPGYSFVNGKVFTPQGREINLNSNGKYWVINSKGTGTTVVPASILRQLASPIVMDIGSKEIPGIDNYFVSPLGAVYSFDPGMYPNGLLLSQHVGSTGYLQVKVADKTRRVHSLVAITFLDKDYIAKGLVAMHLDNNKQNPLLSNIKIGTYSENINAAHADGLHNKKKKSRGK